MKTIISEIDSWKGFLRGLDTLSVGYPWLTLGAIMTLERILTKDMNVCEFGGGGSTVFFAKRCEFVYTIETNEKWINSLCDKLKELDIDNVVFAKSNSEEESIDHINKANNEIFDVILVDSGWFIDENGNKRDPNRRILFEAAIPKLKKGGYLIIDNYQHYGMRHFKYEGFEVYTFDDIGHSGRGTKICVKL